MKRKMAMGGSVIAIGLVSQLMLTLIATNVNVVHAEVDSLKPKVEQTVTVDSSVKKKIETDKVSDVDSKLDSDKSSTIVPVIEEKKDEHSELNSSSLDQKETEVNQTDEPKVEAVGETKPIDSTPEPVSEPVVTEQSMFSEQVRQPVNVDANALGVITTVESSEKPVGRLIDLRTNKQVGRLKSLEMLPETGIMADKADSLIRFGILMVLLTMVFGGAALLLEFITSDR